MFKACYASEMRAADRDATELCSVPSILLMENAALACVRELSRDFDLSRSSVAVFCGKGNNGGDGLAIARHLYNMGTRVEIFLVSGTDFMGDAKINFDIVSGIGVPCETVDTDLADYIIGSFDIIIDAILGTGIKGTVRGAAYDVIEAINRSARYVMSVDVPSGIDSDSGEICGICVNADKTVTFAGYKLGLLMYPAADCAGRVIPDMISMPQAALDAQNLKINVTDAEFVRELIPRRRNFSQKSDYGKVLIIAGSAGMGGAAYMAAEAALKSGAGLVTLVCPDCISTALEAKTTEVMTLPVSSRDGHIAAEAAEQIKDRIRSATAILIGPGLGRSDDAAAVVRAVLAQSRAVTVVDADALNAVARDKSILGDCVCDLIFTPHAMEMSRLMGMDVSYIESHRIEISREFAEENGVSLILKGHRTVVTDPDLTQYINITGNPGLASGGSGDVLAGICAAVAARAARGSEAAAAAAYIHGLAGDIAAERVGEESMSATDVLDALPKAFCRILQVDK